VERDKGNGREGEGKGEKGKGREGMRGGRGLKPPHTCLAAGLISMRHY